MSVTSFRRHATAFAASAAILCGSLLAQENPQEAKIQKALDRLAKCEQRVAAGESFKRLELEFHGLRQDLGRLPQDDERVKDGMARYQKAYDAARGAGATPQPQPRPENDPPPADEGAADKYTLEAKAALDEVEAALPNVRTRAELVALLDKVGSAAMTLTKSTLKARKHSEWKATSTRQQELRTKIKAMTEAAVHPQQQEIARIDSVLRTQAALLKRDGKFEEAARTDIPAAIAALAPQEHEAVEALKKAYADLLAAEKALLEARALAAKREENIQVLKQQALGVNREYPWLGQDSPEAAKAFLEAMGHREALAAEAKRIADEMLAADPKLRELEQYATRDCLGAPEALARHLEATRERYRKKAGELESEAAGQLAAGKPAHTVLEAQKALKVCEVIDPDRAAEYQARFAKTEEMLAQSGANLEQMRAEARAAERFPRAQLEGPPADEIRTAFEPLWRTWCGDPNKAWLKFAVVKPGWTYEEEIQHDGAKYHVYRYEWISVELATPKDEDPSIVIVRDFELRRAPGAKEFQIYRSIGIVEMLRENLDK